MITSCENFPSLSPEEQENKGNNDDGNDKDGEDTAYDCSCHCTNIAIAVVSAVNISVVTGGSGRDGSGYNFHTGLPSESLLTLTGEGLDSIHTCAIITVHILTVIDPGLTCLTCEVTPTGTCEHTYWDSVGKSHCYCMALCCK